MFEFLTTVFIFIATLTFLSILLQNQALFRAVLVILLGVLLFLLPIIFSLSVVLTVSLMGIGMVLLCYALTQMVSLVQLPPSSQEGSQPNRRSLWGMLGKFVFIRIPSLIGRMVWTSFRKRHATSSHRKPRFVYKAPSFSSKKQTRAYFSFAQALRKRSGNASAEYFPTQQPPRTQHHTPSPTRVIQRMRNVIPAKTTQEISELQTSSYSRKALIRLFSSHRTR